MLVIQPGWKLLEKIVNANIEIVSEQILDGLENETPESINRLRDKLRVYKDVRNTPRDMIDKFESKENEIPEVDPFDTVESLKKARGQVNTDS